MSAGLRRVWERGPRETIAAKDKGKDVVMRGKNGGPIIRQEVVLRLVPKGGRMIQVDEDTVLLGVSLGLMRLAEPGVHEFTPRGLAYFSEWLDRKIAEPEEGA